MGSSDYQLELTTLALGNWIDLPSKSARAAVDRRLRQICRDPRGLGALAEAGRDEYRVRVEDVVIRYAVDDQGRRVTVLRIRAV